MARQALAFIFVILALFSHHVCASRASEQLSSLQVGPGLSVQQPVSLSQVGTLAELQRTGLHDRSLRKEAVEQLRTSLLSGFDWDSQNEVAPWLTNIVEGTNQAIGIVLGQSLNPDSSAPQVLVDRALKAKELLDRGTVSMLVVSGGDPEGVGKTEASQMAKVLEDHGIPKNKIIWESQGATTAENAWFALRWIPKGTGKVYIVTSDFHIARATYIVTETFNYFYRMVEDTYKNDSRWNSSTRKYPRLAVEQVPTASYCGSQAAEPSGDIHSASLAELARNEMSYLGTGEVPMAMFGPPVNTINKVQYIWPIQIDVTLDPGNKESFSKAMAQSMNAARALCTCTGPPERVGPAIEPYPLTLPPADVFPEGMTSSDWKKICTEFAKPGQAE
eukprot:TRINITY_DN7386_c0_g2_i1.p1 TRINITY_DN7386_c0_g2~~TRINITY_DN7386_c0_g2_i1.p1  ORF type:complete len:404 (+),score=78.37 TRINITY_DN7386_c0_g2_i1:44-1213(+)